MVTLKKIIAAVILLALCSYSTWKEMQTLAIVSIILFLCILYLERVKLLFELFFSLAKQTRQAKFGSLELNIGDSLRQTILENITTEKEWIKTIVSDLTPTHLALLLAINKAGQFHCNNQVKNTLRDLRAKGLIGHNMDTIAKSDTVWLTEMGIELVNEVTSPKTPSK